MIIPQQTRSHLLQAKKPKVLLDRCSSLESPPLRRSRSIDVVPTQLQYVNAGNAVSRSKARGQRRRTVTQHALSDHPVHRARTHPQQFGCFANCHFGDDRVMRIGTHSTGESSGSEKPRMRALLSVFTPNSRETGHQTRTFRAKCQVLAAQPAVSWSYFRRQGLE